MLQNAYWYLLAKIGFDTAENEPAKIPQAFADVANLTTLAEGRAPVMPPLWPRQRQTTAVAANFNPDTGPTPPGYNKQLRDLARICLLAQAVLLLSDSTYVFSNSE